ncbi:MAG TPA: sulfotransferase [Bryobacteraceae bacterium]|nr:sulfotransferase [Bryobacteraceae bacterium]
MIRLTMPAAGPIFIVGAPRSGTTLLRVILDRHPAIAVPDETEFFHFVYDRRRAFGDLRVPCNRQRLVDQYLATERVRRLGLDLTALREALMREGTGYPEFFLSLLRFNAAHHGKQIPGEKSPYHALVTELLCAWFPDCRIIHLVRDPRDVAASTMRMPWAARSVVASARAWRACNLAAYQSRRRPNYLMLRYEDLVADPGEQLGRICRHIGVECAPAILGAADVEARVRWWGRRAHGTLTEERLGRWRVDLAPWQAAAVERVAGPHMEMFGYSREQPRATLRIMARAAVEACREYMIQKLVRIPKIWYYLILRTRLAQEEVWQVRADRLYAKLGRKAGEA